MLGLMQDWPQGWHQDRRPRRHLRLAGGKIHKMTLRDRFKDYRFPNAAS